MKKQFLIGALAVGTVISGFMLDLKPAHSLMIADFNPGRCPVGFVPNTTDDINDNVSPLDNNPGLQASGNVGTCQIGSTNNDFETNPLSVNTDQMFGVSDWIFGFRQNGINAISGTLDISTWLSGLSEFTSLLVVLKGGNGAFPQSNYVGYLLDSETFKDDPNTLIEYFSPFYNSNLTGQGVRNAQNVSHITLYYRNGEPIPTPALLPGLVGMGVAAIRKKKNEAASEDA